MLKIKNEPKWRRKVKSLCLQVFNKLENNCNCDFTSNGEENFLKSFISTHKEQELVIFDVGSNVGLYIEKILGHGKQVDCDLKIHAFEPTNSCSEKLQQKFAHNQNVKLNKFGVSDRSGKATIYYDNETSGLASLYQRDLKSYNIELSQQETIELRRLEDYINENSIGHINLLKIDIEGHELSAFRGLGEFLNAKFIDAIQFEYGGANLDSYTSLMEISSLLTNAGFSLYKIMPTYLEKRKYEPRMENFQYANYVALSEVNLKKES